MWPVESASSRGVPCSSCHSPEAQRALNKFGTARCSKVGMVLDGAGREIRNTLLVQNFLIPPGAGLGVNSNRSLRAVHS